MGWRQHYLELDLTLLPAVIASRLRIAVVTASKLSPFLKVPILQDKKKLLLKMVKDPVVKLPF